MVDDSCLHHENSQKQLRREREQVDIIRHLTERLQERNKEVNRLQQELTHKDAVSR